MELLLRMIEKRPNRNNPPVLNYILKRMRHINMRDKSGDFLVIYESASHGIEWCIRSHSDSFESRLKEASCTVFTIQATAKLETGKLIT